MIIALFAILLLLLESTALGYNRKLIEKFLKSDKNDTRTLDELFSD